MILLLALLLLLWLAVMPFFAPELPPINYFLMAGGGILGIIASLFFREALILLSHRLSHAPVGRVMLYPWGGVPALAAPPTQEARGLFVASLASLLAAAIFLLVFVHGAGPEIPLSVMAVVLVLVLFNALIAFVGLLPFYPLRCGRLIVALIARKLGTERARNWARGLSLTGSASLLVLGIWRFFEGTPLTGLVMAVTAGLFAFAGITHARKEYT